MAAGVRLWVLSKRRRAAVCGSMQRRGAQVGRWRGAHCCESTKHVHVVIIRCWASSQTLGVRGRCLAGAGQHPRPRRHGGRMQLPGFVHGRVREPGGDRRGLGRPDHAPAVRAGRGGHGPQLEPLRGAAARLGGAGVRGRGVEVPGAPIRQAGQAVLGMAHVRCPLCTAYLTDAPCPTPGAGEVVEAPCAAGAVPLSAVLSDDGRMLVAGCAAVVREGFCPTEDELALELKGLRIDRDDAPRAEVSNRGEAESEAGGGCEGGGGDTAGCGHACPASSCTDCSGHEHGHDGCHDHDHAGCAHGDNDEDAVWRRNRHKWGPIMLFQAAAA